MSVMVSDMKTKTTAKKASRRPTAKVAAPRRVFTVRDLNRQPQAVLNEARKKGGVHVHSRTGERFLLRADPAQESSGNSRAEFHSWLAELHDKIGKNEPVFSAEGWEHISKVIAGE